MVKLLRRDSNEGDGNEGGKRVMATRAMVTVTATATTWVMAMVMRLAVTKRARVRAMRVAGKEECKGGKAMAMATRMASKWTVMATKRAMAMATRMEGKLR